MTDFNVIQNTADISFIDDKTVDDVSAEMIADYEKYMTDYSGTAVTLDAASPHRMILLAAAAQIYQALQAIDRAGKQNLLKYSYGEFLDNLGLLKGVTRKAAAAAVTTLRFTLSATRDVATAIPAGTRAGNLQAIYFATDEYAEIPAGSEFADVAATCTTAGTAGNDLPPGEISVMIDPIGYMAGVQNVTATAGGAEIETDDSFAERIFLAPSAYSTAGCEDSYIYHAKQYSAAIGDVVASSDNAAGQVDIVFLMANGDTPSAEMIDGLTEYLSAKERRPMTDRLTVAAPGAVEYSIEFTYYINRSDSARAVEIQSAVAAAVDEYTAWQRAIARDINPSKLIALIMAAGAKRVEVIAPEHIEVGATEVPELVGTAVVNYGGLEND
jgi:phage-related baseplate assembly protein